MRKRLALIPEGETMGNGILFFIDLQALRDGLDTCPTIFYPDGNMDFSNTGNLFVPNPLFGKCEEEIRLLWGIMGEGK